MGRGKGLPILRSAPLLDPGTKQEEGMYLHYHLDSFPSLCSCWSTKTPRIYSLEETKRVGAYIFQSRSLCILYMEKMRHRNEQISLNPSFSRDSMGQHLRNTKKNGLQMTAQSTSQYSTAGEKEDRLGLNSIHSFLFCQLQFPVFLESHSPPVLWFPLQAGKS